MACITGCSLPAAAASGGRSIELVLTGHSTGRLAGWVAGPDGAGAHIRTLFGPGRSARTGLLSSSAPGVTAVCCATGGGGRPSVLWAGFADGCLHAYAVVSQPGGGVWSTLLLARRAHLSAVTGLAIGPAHVVTASAQGVLRRWSADLAEPAAAALRWQAERAARPAVPVQVAVASWNVNAVCARTRLMGGPPAQGRTAAAC